MITSEQAGAIATLVRTIRPAWDQLLIMNIIRRDLAHHDLADLTHAAIRCAQDQTMRTPTALGFTDADHWRPTVRDTETPDERAARKQAQLDEREEARRARARQPHHAPLIAAARAEIRRTIRYDQEQQA